MPGLASPDGVRKRAGRFGFGWHGAAALVVFTGLACGDSTGPATPGSIRVQVETSGFLQDDAYQLLIDGENHGLIASNDEVTVSELDPGSYVVDLEDLTGNCTVESVSVPVVSEETAEVLLAVVCSYAEPDTYTLRYDQDGLNLDTGEMTECTGPFCAVSGWDLLVARNSARDVHSAIYQNGSNGVEIAHLPGVVFEDLTEQDVDGAEFTTDFVDESFDAGRVILVRTDLGNTYMLGNPDEDDEGLTFDAALIAEP